MILDLGNLNKVSPKK